MAMSAGPASRHEGFPTIIVRLRGSKPAGREGKISSQPRVSTGMSKGLWL
jgi:hypothetical protein